MSIAASMLPEFDHEFANTRKVIARIPDDKLAFTPHPRSMTMGQLAAHIAILPAWMVATLKQDSYDFGREANPTCPTDSTAGILAKLDQYLAMGRPVLASAPDASMFTPWSLLNNGVTLFTMPRVAVLRSMILNHLIHHRGQLTVYLRINNIPLPALYGPSADEQS
jgi:uncharacterized damage-inducible protein DinB